MTFIRNLATKIIIILHTIYLFKISMSIFPVEIYLIILDDRVVLFISTRVMRDEETENSIGIGFVSYMFSEEADLVNHASRTLCGFCILHKIIVPGLKISLTRAEIMIWLELMVCYPGNQIRIFVPTKLFQKFRNELSFL